MEGFRLLCCGDRNWTAQWVIKRYLEQIIANNKIECIIEGEARGADIISRRVAALLDIPVEKFPADWKGKGKAAGVIRNQQMIDEGRPTHVLAFHNNIKSSKGTKDMMKRALKHNIHVVLIRDCVNHFTAQSILDEKELSKKSSDQDRWWNI